MATLKELSKVQYAPKAGEQATLEQLNFGALQRIADASEKMAADRIKLENDLKFYKENYRLIVEENNRLLKSITGYKSWHTRLNNKIKALKNEKPASNKI